MPETSVIHDLGYQRYTGPRLGRAYTFGTLYLHSLRTAFGLGRGVKAKLFSWGIAGIIGAVGLILTVIEAQTGEAQLTSPEFVDQMAVLSVMFLAVVGPELVCRDQHTRTLSLYFARPLRRSDYALARLGGLISALWLVLAAPLLLMFVGAALSTKKGAGEVADAAGHLATGLAHAATHAVLLGSLSLLIASLIRRRAVAAAAIVGAFLAGAPIVALTEGLGGSAGTSELVSIVHPPTALSYLDAWLYSSGNWGYNSAHHIANGPFLAGYVLVATAASVALLVTRYRKVSA